MRPVKTDRNDAAGLAQIMRTGWFKEVRIKSRDSYQVRSLLVAREMLVRIGSPNCCANPWRSSPSGMGSASSSPARRATTASRWSRWSETDSITLLIRFVSAGLGITFLPRFFATIQQARGELAIVAVDEPLLMSESAHCIVRARRRLPASVNAVATFLSGRMAAFG